MMLLQYFFFLIFFIKTYVVGTHHRLVEAIQMSSHNICFYKVDKSLLRPVSLNM